MGEVIFGVWIVPEAGIIFSDGIDDRSFNLDTATKYVWGILGWAWGFERAG